MLLAEPIRPSDEATDPWSPDGGDIDPPADDDDGDSNRWVTVATFWQPTEAHIARLKLESEEIDCVLIDENLVAMDWLYANAVGGIKLRVPEAEATLARLILTERPPRLAHLAGDGETCAEPDDDPQQQPRSTEQPLQCPDCGSSRVERPLAMRRNLWAMVAMMLMATTVLIVALPVLLVAYLVWLRPYRCKACGNVWQRESQARGFEVKPHAGGPE